MSAISAQDVNKLNDKIVELVKVSMAKMLRRQKGCRYANSSDESGSRRRKVRRQDLD